MMHFAERLDVEMEFAAAGQRSRQMGTKELLPASTKSIV